MLKLIILPLNIQIVPTVIYVKLLYLRNVDNIIPCIFQIRLDKALDATEIPMEIARDNLECRSRRQGPDMVKDNVEIQLLRVGHFLHCPVKYIS